MIIQFILFFLFFLAFIGITHFYVYISIVKHLDIKNTLTRIYLLISFSFLSFSFVMSSALVRYFENFATKTFYLLASIWSGLLVYLILTSTIGWVFYFFNKYSRYKINLRILKMVLLTVAVLTSVYGIINAQIPKIFSHTVKIENLPESWRGKTAVQISDLHLGAINGAGFANKIMDQISSISPDIIFITGDYYDGTSMEIKKLAEPLKKLHPQLGTFFVSGNHETYTVLDEIIKELEANNVTYMKDEIKVIDGLSIIGLEYARPGEKKNYESLVNQVAAEKPSILLYHEPRFVEAAKSIGIDLQLAGHTHEGQMFPFMFITNLIYDKYHHGYHEEGSFHINTSSGTGTWGPPMRVGTNSEITVFKFE